MLPLFDLVKSKFSMEIRQKLHDLEFQTGSDFDLDQVMQKLDYIINSREKPIDFISPRIEAQLPAQPLQLEVLYDAQNNLTQWYKDTLQLLDHFWELWHSEYLSALRERQQYNSRRRRFTTSTSKIGDVVIIAEDKLPRGQWPYGIITKLLQSKDGCIRSAEVRSSNDKNENLDTPGTFLVATSVVAHRNCARLDD
ncbi:unnamed protein product [Heligmosomoides polygyrus]|uniref:DUF5641 domain-containing protein n=1 Tax=Heligmosomoides polygyrus TaxID=6339 RepID=A0A183GM76_HELPZ|nr:unnamed protein product [Heligmosomoides polygyrus]